MRVREFVAGLIVGVIIATASATFGADAIRLVVNGKEIAFPDAPPQIINGRTMVPARPLAEALGATVTWDGEGRAVVITTNTTPRVEASALFVGTIKTNGTAISTSLSYNEAGNVCVPLRTLSEFATVSSPAGFPGNAFGIEVDGVLLTKADLWSYEGRSFVCASAMTDHLRWKLLWDGALNTLTISK